MNAILVLLCTVASGTSPLRLHTSLRGEVIETLRADFEARHPDIKLEIRSIGSGDIIHEIRSAQAAGRPVPDVMLHSDITEFIRMQQRNELEPFRFLKSAGVSLKVEPADGSFHAIRLAVLGIVFNHQRVQKPIRSWMDLLDPSLKGRVGLPDPTLSGTGFTGLAQLQIKYGWTFLEDLKANGAMLVRNSSKVVDETAGGNLYACIGVDYLAFDWIRKGAPLQVVYPEPFLVAYNCVGILKGTQNLPAAKRFVQYLVSKECQTLLGHFGTMPVRRDIRLPRRPSLPGIDRVIQGSIRWDPIKVSLDREAILGRIMGTFQ